MKNSNYLGLEFGSTRIKAVVIDNHFNVVETSDYKWQSKLVNNIWTYDLSLVWQGLITVLKGLTKNNQIDVVGISGMMHGYLAFDKDWNLLTPFRTWQNTMTKQASDILTKEFNFNIPQRWSIAHLYQAILNNEEHIHKIAHITTLAGYVHYMLTGLNAVGIGEASGIFPIDEENKTYNQEMINSFNKLIKKHNLNMKIENLLPEILLAGNKAGVLTEKGNEIINNLLPIGTSFAPCEGDAGTGMVATNAVASGTGNVSAGTSIFSMVVLEKPLKNIYEEIDMVTTPNGKPVAMVHCNNCTNDSNAWFNVFKQCLSTFGLDVSDNDLYTKLYELSLNGEKDCDNVLVCNYLSGESVTHLDQGRPIVIRKPDSVFNLENFIRSMLYSTMATLKIGMDILAKENVKIISLTGHGGLFKTKGVGQKYMAAACNAPITCMSSAGEGGPYGMAILASYVDKKENNESLEQYLESKVFINSEKITIKPDIDDVNGFNKYMEQYKKLLIVEEVAIKNI